MFDVIDALELMGADADLVRTEPGDLAALLPADGLDPSLRSALLQGDAGRLHALLRAPDNVCCLINPAEEEEEEEEEDGEEGDEESEDGEDDEEADEARSR